jgi:hypothetical protein
MKFFNAPRVSSPRSLMLPGPAPVAGGVPLLLVLLPVLLPPPPPLLLEGAASVAPSVAPSFFPSVVLHRPRRTKCNAIARCDAAVAAPFTTPDRTNIF